MTVINQLNITDYLVNNNKIEGAVGFSIADATVYEIRAKKVLIATGGAAGLYRPNNPGFSVIKCGIHRSIQEPDMQWESMRVRR